MALCVFFSFSLLGLGCHSEAFSSCLANFGCVSFGSNGMQKLASFWTGVSDAVACYFGFLKNVCMFGAPQWCQASAFSQCDLYHH